MEKSNPSVPSTAQFRFIAVHVRDTSRYIRIWVEYYISLKHNKTLQIVTYIKHIGIYLFTKEVIILTKDGEYDAQGWSMSVVLML